MLFSRLVLTRGAAPASSSAITRRLASTSQHTEESHHHSQRDEGPYPEETFNTPFWRRTVLAAALGYGIYSVYPHLDPDGDYITRFLAHNNIDSRVWKVYDSIGLYAALIEANDRLLVESAQKSPIHRLRNPMSLDYASQRNVQVGSTVDMSKVRVKNSD